MFISFGEIYSFFSYKFYDIMFRQDTKTSKTISELNETHHCIVFMRISDMKKDLVKLSKW